MSDWNLVQIYCDEMGGIDENDLMIEVRGNKEERENLISQLLQRMKSKYKDGGEVGENKIDFKNFTIAEFNSFVKSINNYGDIQVSVSVGNNVNKEGTYTKKIDLKKLKDLSMSLGDGKEISVVTGSENIYADVLVYDNNYDKGYKEYTISLFSKDDKKGLKSVVNSIIEKFKTGGGVLGNENYWKNMPKNAAKDLAKYYGNKKLAFNKKELNFNKKDLAELKEVQMMINKYHPEFNNYLSLMHKEHKMKTGGMVVTSIKDIPNFKKRLDEGKITYRGLGMGKLSDDFYDLAGETGSRIKVDGKEYFITNTEFDKFNRGKDGLMRIRFAAPYRKGYSKGGGIDINELNMPVIRTQFEDEEYEFKDGGNVKVGDKVMLPEIKMRDGKIQFEKVENGEVLYIENGIYGVLNPKTKRIHQVSLNQIKFENGGTTKGFCYTIGGL